MKLIRFLLRLQTRVAALIFLPAAGVLLLVAAGLFLSEVRFARAAQHATGTITEMEERVDSDGGVGYYPHFTFAKADGAPVEIVSNVGRQPPSFEVGEQVPVLFSPNDPKGAKIATTFQVYGIAIILLIIGAIFVPLGFLARYLKGRYFPV